LISYPRFLADRILHLLSGADRLCAPYKQLGALLRSVLGRARLRPCWRSVVWCDAGSDKCSAPPRFGAKPRARFGLLGGTESIVDSISPCREDLSWHIQLF